MMEMELQSARPLPAIARACSTRVAEPSWRWDFDPYARWMEEDLKEARALQILLLPDKAACAEGLRIPAGFRPAHQVSGDIYDLYECNH